LPRRLAEVLGHWVDLVEDGVWAVEEDGVEEDAAWFDFCRSLAVKTVEDVCICQQWAERLKNAVEMVEHSRV
jgi:hypothetical protein